MPRIIAGEKKGLPLATLKGEHTRPSGDRLKEAVFSIVQTRIKDCVFLDLFAGSGQMGLEALSRGAAQALFLEKSRAASRVLRENLLKADFGERAIMRTRDTLKEVPALVREGFRADIIYFDPPWQKERQFFLTLAPYLSSLLNEGGLVIAEADEKSEMPVISADLNCFRTCHYGRAVVLFYTNMRECIH